MATTDTFGLSPEALKAARLNFRVAEGPFSTTAQDIISYSDSIVLHVKRPPLAEGGMFGKCSYTLRFYAAGTLYYRVNLGRHKTEIVKMIDGNSFHLKWAPKLAMQHGEIMLIWSDVEAKKDRALIQDFKIHKVTIKTQEVTVVQQEGTNPLEGILSTELIQDLRAIHKHSDEADAIIRGVLLDEVFESMDDLEVLQKLNARTRDWVAAHPLPPKEYTIPDALIIELKNHRAA